MYDFLISEAWWMKSMTQAFLTATITLMGYALLYNSRINRLDIKRREEHNKILSSVNNINLVKDNINSVENNINSVKDNINSVKDNINSVENILTFISDDVKQKNAINQILLPQEQEFKNTFLKFVHEWEISKKTIIDLERENKELKEENERIKQKNLRLELELQIKNKEDDWQEDRELEL